MTKKKKKKTNKKQSEDSDLNAEDSDSDAEDSVVVLDSVAQDLFLVLGSEGVDSTTTLAHIHTHSQITGSCKIGLASRFMFEDITIKLSNPIKYPPVLVRDS